MVKFIDFDWCAKYDYMDCIGHPTWQGWLLFLGILIIVALIILLLPAINKPQEQNP